MTHVEALRENRPHVFHVETAQHMRALLVELIVRNKVIKPFGVSLSFTALLAVTPASAAAPRGAAGSPHAALPGTATTRGFSAGAVARSPLGLSRILEEMRHRVVIIDRLR